MNDDEKHAIAGPAQPVLPLPVRPIKFFPIQDGHQPPVYVGQT